MERRVGTVVRGLRAPMIKEGDDIAKITVESVLEAAKCEGFSLRDRDVIGITESLVARAQGNYVTVDNIVEDLNSKFKGDDIAVLFPILSRNRFAIILKAIARTGKNVHLFLNYPSDEVGNHLMDVDAMDRLGVDPYKDFLTEEKYRELFGEHVNHPFTGVDYVRMYREISEEDNIKIYLTNDAKEALKYADDILVANIHERGRTKRILNIAGAKNVHGIDEIMSSPIDGSGYNDEYGLLGSNTSTEEKVKLFPRDCDKLVRSIQQEIKAQTGKMVEVLVYGDGAFKDPVGKIWELADPVVSPGFTDGLLGTPSEIKLKYVADNEFSDMESSDMMDEIKKKIRANESAEFAEHHSLGTTPRQLTDLIGSLCDLTSGSGDKGTPIILVQGYFDNLASE
ncbi:F420-0:gamma-glutamyl ligase [Andreesenia angusta]|uniref:F420-0:gamma-glutamyl ligase n=1 Tax=Andreesenia angusta TaxID=39480 RepID=A0A1S1V6X6_9FIRM|nr:coenzyme F420-0:L-glutamate ligase [Andreesenia angusta]OHW62368.1 F420-0:gamma-glutamyl ligase [Andreesenia angusta]